jgi:hypothetical protein
MIHIKSLLKQDMFGGPEKKGTIIEVSNEDDSDSEGGLESSEPELDFGKKPTISSFRKPKKNEKNEKRRDSMADSMMSSVLDLGGSNKGSAFTSPNVLAKKK